MEQTLALIKRSHKGDKDARNILAQQNMGLVYTVARRFNGRGCEMEDLIQIGSIGLLKAIDKFDLSYDVRFSTYAVPMIAGEIKRFLRDDGMIKGQPLFKGDGGKSVHDKRKAGKAITGGNQPWKKFQKRSGRQEKRS